MQFLFLVENSLFIRAQTKCSYFSFFLLSNNRIFVYKISTILNNEIRGESETRNCG